MSWLNIDSFPELKQKSPVDQEKHREISSNIPEEEYIEFDPFLFTKRTRITSRRLNKYKENPSKLYRKVRKLERKAVIELSKCRPMLIDKYDVYKLRFIIDLNRKRDFNLNIKVKFFKSHNKEILGQNYFLDSFVKKDRYYSKKIGDSCLHVQFIKRCPLSDVIHLNMEDIHVIKAENVDIQTKLSTLNKKVNEDPHDISSWLKLVDLQREKLGNSSNKAVTESELAVLTKAILKNPTSEELLLRQLYITYNISDSNSLKNSLDEIVFNFPHKLKFWLLYFNYNQSDFSNLSLHKIIDFYSKALKRIEDLKSPNVRQSHRLVEPLGSQYQFQIYCSLSNFLLNIDHTERLISLFQMLIEFNLADFKNTPLQKAKLETLKLSCESYYNSKNPKVGNVNSHGFEYFINSKSTSIDLKRYQSLSEFLSNLPDQCIAPDEETIVKDIGDKTLSWLALETFRMNTSLFPSMNDDVNEDDDEKIIIFDDISSLLHKLDGTYNFDLCLLFLGLMGVPIPSEFSPNLTDYFKDSLVMTDFSLQFPHLLWQFETIIGGHNICLRRDLSSIWLHFGTNNPSNYLPLHASTVNFVRNSFIRFLSTKSFTTQQLQYFSIIWIQFELLHALTINESSLNSAMLVCRQVLEMPENRSNPPIWLLYSICLIHSNKNKQYLNTMTKLINSFDPNPNPSDLPSYFTFVRFYIQTHFSNEFSDTPDSEIYNIIEKVYKTVSEKKLNSVPQFSAFVMKMVNLDFDLIILSNLIIIQFFFNCMVDCVNSAVNEFNKIFEYTRTKCVVGKVNDIPLFNLRCDHYDTKNRIYKLCQIICENISIILYLPKIYPHTEHSRLSRILSVCVEMFPESNLIHQWFYRSNQVKPTLTYSQIFYSHVMNEAIDTQCSNMCSFVFYSYYIVSFISIYIKTCDSEALLSNSSPVHHFINWFERVVSHPVYRFRPLAWRIYLRLLYLANAHQLVIEVFYRSLQSVPYCKDIYLDIIYFKGLAVSDVIDILVEKSVRLRLPLEELDLLLTL